MEHSNLLNPFVSDQENEVRTCITLIEVENDKHFKYSNTSFFEQIKFNTEDYFPKHTNITTTLRWKLFTKVIREPSEEAWISLDRRSN